MKCDLKHPWPVLSLTSGKLIVNNLFWLKILMSYVFNFSSTGCKPETAKCQSGHPPGAAALCGPVPCFYRVLYGGVPVTSASQTLTPLKSVGAKEEPSRLLSFEVAVPVEHRKGYLTTIS